MEKLMNEESKKYKMRKERKKERKKIERKKEIETQIHMKCSIRSLEKEQKTDN